MNKYGAKKVKYCGLTFDSKLEFKRYNELMLLIQAGEISDLKIHTKFPIEINGVKVCNVINDFDYIEVKTGKWVSEDVKTKATDTAISRLKRKMVCAFYPTVEWRVMWGGRA